MKKMSTIFCYTWTSLFILVSISSLIMALVAYPKGGEASIVAFFYALLPGMPFSLFFNELLTKITDFFDVHVFRALGVYAIILHSMISILIGYFFWIRLPKFILKKIKLYM